MVKHVLIAAAAATALLSGGTAHAAQQCGVVCVGIADTNPCEDLAVLNCHICVLPESSPVVPCIFEN